VSVGTHPAGAITGQARPCSTGASGTQVEGDRRLSQRRGAIQNADRRSASAASTIAAGAGIAAIAASATVGPIIRSEATEPAASARSRETGDATGSSDAPVSGYDRNVDHRERRRNEDNAEGSPATRAAGSGTASDATGAAASSTTASVVKAEEAGTATTSSAATTTAAIAAHRASRSVTRNVPGRKKAPHHGAGCALSPIGSGCAKAAVRAIAAIVVQTRLVGSAGTAGSATNWKASESTVLAAVTSTTAVPSEGRPASSVSSESEAAATIATGFAWLTRLSR
jgi:hypothetical protein